MELTDPDTARDELKQIRQWRLEQLELEGFPEGDASRLAYSEADLHRAIDLLRGGCPSPVVVDILI